MQVDEININKLRDDLINYFGTAMFKVSPIAMFDLNEVKNASPEKLILIAKKYKFNLNDYK